MKKLLKPIITAMLLFIGFAVSAQDSPFSFIVKAGFNISNSTLDIGDNNNLMQKQPKIGYNIGVMGDYAFSKSFSLQSGLAYTTKGVELKGITHGEAKEETHWVEARHMGYLQLPLLAVYRFNITDEFNIFINAGPYAAYGTSGKTTTTNRYYNMGNVPNDKNKEETFGEDALKRFDFGLLGGLGAEMNCIFLSFNFELGLVGVLEDNLISQGFEDFKNKNASVAIGYRF